MNADELIKRLLAGDALTLAELEVVREARLEHHNNAEFGVTA